MNRISWDEGKKRQMTKICNAIVKPKLELPLFSAFTDVPFN